MDNLKFKKPQFIRNRQNDMHLITDANGETKEIWVSRSMATCVTVIKDDFILLVKRGEKMDNAGKWCLPCGYLDYDETLQECAARELWEETNMYIFPNYLVLVDIDDSITANSQNVTFCYLYAFEPYNLYSDCNYDWDNLHKLSNQNADEGEIAEIKWISIKDIMEMDADLFAFNHKERILKQYFQNLKK
jgi:8-oxo-dGTP pyrophosphatase MutT (NUDIX family)